MQKFNKILTIGLLSILFSINGYSQGTKIEKSKLIISNDFVVVSNATFIGNVTFGGETISNWPAPGTNWSKYISLQDVNFGANSPTNITSIVYTNGIEQKVGKNNGTNGIYWTVGTNNYWILFP